MADAKKDDKDPKADAKKVTAASADDFPDEPAAPPKPDETIPGGKYVVGGKLVNAHGERIDESGKVLSAEEAAAADEAAAKKK